MSKNVKFSVTADEHFADALGRLRKALGASSDADALRKSMVLADLVLDHSTNDQIVLEEDEGDGRRKVVSIPLKVIRGL